MERDGIKQDDAVNYMAQIEAMGHGPTKLMTWHTPLNNYEPGTRSYRDATGYAIRYEWDLKPGTRQTRYVLMGETTKELEGAYLIDDGQTVSAFYGGPARDVRGKLNPHTNPPEPYPNPEIDPHLILSPVTPLNGWQLGPRRCWHVKVQG